MGWLDYHHLIEKYGSVDAAPREEREAAARANPNTPAAARALAERTWREEHPAEAPIMSTMPTRHERTTQVRVSREAHRIAKLEAARAGVSLEAWLDKAIREQAELQARRQSEDA